MIGERGRSRRRAGPLGAAMALVTCIVFACAEAASDGNETSAGGSAGAAGESGASSGAPAGGAGGAGGASAGGHAETRGGAAGERASAGGGQGGEASGGAGGVGAGGVDTSAPGFEITPIGDSGKLDLDLLIVLGNTPSMLEKQRALSVSLSRLIERLLLPDCTPSAALGSSEDCSTARPLSSLHLAVITPSLGGHGSDACNSAAEDEHAHLVPTLHPNVPSWSGAGFLAWDPSSTALPAAEHDIARFESDLNANLLAAGTSGCRYQATLEAAYRFLIDPAPPAKISVSGGSSIRTGLDVVLSAQRQAFLRPDSLVGIVLVSDQNDCSIRDDGLGYLVGASALAGTPFRMPRATSACARDPNDPCCAPCPDANHPEIAVSRGIPTCGSPALDSECLKGPLSAAGDPLELRCFDQVRRFGVDLLYPLDRYVTGFTGASFGPLPTNGQRAPNDVFVLSLVGVPWQDLSDLQSIGDGSRLRYLDWGQMEAAGRWPLVSVPPGAKTPPLDLLMLEANTDRSTRPGAIHPLLNVPLAPPGSESPRENPINGHESALAGDADLQYACTFPLPEPRDCANAPSADCECRSEELGFSRSLCQPPTGGPASTTQYYDKAYPGTRFAEFTRELGRVTGTALIASICPKDLSGAQDAEVWGYNAAVRSFADKIQARVVPSGCLKERVEADDSGELDPCRVVLVSRDHAGLCGPKGGGSSASYRIRSALSRQGLCQPSVAPCLAEEVCELTPFQGAAAAACRSGSPLGTPGYCIVDPARGWGSLDDLSGCRSRQQVRVGGIPEDLAGTSVYLVCPR